MQFVQKVATKDTYNIKLNWDLSEQDHDTKHRREAFFVRKQIGPKILLFPFLGLFLFLNINHLLDCIVSTLFQSVSASSVANLP